MDKIISRRNLLIASASVPIALGTSSTILGATPTKPPSTNPAYWLGRSTFRDVKMIEQYIKTNGAFDAYPKGSYELLARDGKVVHLEGGSRYEHYYLWKMQSMAMALDAYNRPQYQEAAKLRRGGSSANELVVFEGGDHYKGKY